MKKLGKQIAQAWQALAQADLGETANYDEMRRRIGVPEDEIARHPGASYCTDSPLRRPRRLIALATRGPVVRGALDYVREAIPRLDVDVALLSATDAPPLDPRFAAACAEQGASIIEQSIGGHFEQGLRRFLEQHPQTLFVVIGDHLSPRGWSPRLPVPVVMVAELELAPTPTPALAGGAA